MQTTCHIPTHTRYNRTIYRYGMCVCNYDGYSKLIEKFVGVLYTHGFVSGNETQRTLRGDGLPETLMKPNGSMRQTRQPMGNERQRERERERERESERESTRPISSPFSPTTAQGKEDSQSSEMNFACEYANANRRKCT
eukprot:gb/GECG01000524.1/.p1 GENE.gb/GECG01000524.1/~~gb/GECG01000524.1/.p1  ORF type:complete len:139 (+),score=8.81 gb/GECG01000524.1/:1-417(+)